MPLNKNDTLRTHYNIQISQFVPQSKKTIYWNQAAKVAQG